MLQLRLLTLHLSLPLHKYSLSIRENGFFPPLVFGQAAFFYSSFCVAIRRIRAGLSRHSLLLAPVGNFCVAYCF